MALTSLGLAVTFTWRHTKWYNPPKFEQDWYSNVRIML